MLETDYYDRVRTAVITEFQDRPEGPTWTSDVAVHAAIGTIFADTTDIRKLDTVANIIRRLDYPSWHASAHGYPLDLPGGYSSQFRTRDHVLMHGNEWDTPVTDPETEPETEPTDVNPAWGNHAG
jgi:hypothetical protein